MQCIGAWTDSQTTDEGAHLGAGLSYWRTGDFRLNPEHPPLVKLLAAAPLVGRAQLQPTADAALWAARDQWTIGRLVLYQQLNARTETQFALWLARLPMIAIWLTLGLVVWRWAEERAGRWGGALAAVVFAFEPTLLGHGHLITTDVAVAAGLTTTFWLGTRLVDRPRWRLVFLIATVFSLTQLTKFSALLLWPLLFGLLALALTTAHQRWNWSWWRRTLGVTLLVSAALTWIVYGFERVPAAADPRIDRLWHERDTIVGTPELQKLPGFVQWIATATPPGSDLRTWLTSASHIAIPAYSYWRGFFSVASHNAVGHAAYLFGEQASQGWWYYFPIALAVKTPLPIIALVLALIIVAAARWRHLGRPKHLFVYLPVVLYLLWSLTSKINIGVRHLIPILPMTFVALGSLGPAAKQLWHRWALAVTVAAVPLVTLLAWPNTIGYFNAAAGGTNGGQRIILDSNLDWNQDLWRLRDWLDQRGTPPAMIALFGSVPVEVVHLDHDPVPSDEQVRINGRPHRLVIISKGILYSVDQPFQWLRELQPSARIGSSILVYDLR